MAAHMMSSGIRKKALSLCRVIAFFRQALPAALPRLRDGCEE
jgi:hypothetical protein